MNTMTWKEIIKLGIIKLKKLASKIGVLKFFDLIGNAKGSYFKKCSITHKKLKNDQINKRPNQPVQIQSEIIQSAAIEPILQNTISAEDGRICHVRNIRSSHSSVYRTPRLQASGEELSIYRETGGRQSNLLSDLEAENERITALEQSEDPIAREIGALQRGTIEFAIGVRNLKVDQQLLGERQQRLGERQQRLGNEMDSTLKSIQERESKVRKSRAGKPSIEELSRRVARRKLSLLNND